MKEAFLHALSLTSLRISLNPRSLLSHRFILSKVKTFVLRHSPLDSNHRERGFPISNGSLSHRVSPVSPLLSMQMAPEQCNYSAEQHWGDSNACLWDYSGSVYVDRLRPSVNDNVPSVGTVAGFRFRLWPPANLSKYFCANILPSSFVLTTRSAFEPT